jgi:hypothetical protein
MQQGNQPDSAFISDTLRFRFQPLISLITVFAWTLAVYSATTSPWKATALAGVALLSSCLWRWRKIETIEAAGLIPLGLSALISFSVIAVPKLSSSPNHDLLCVILVAIGFTINGFLLATASQRSNPLTSSSIPPWLHAGMALFIAFAACATDRLVSENLTTVFWGISAIVLFISGLYAGLRAYRLMGLIGLAFCIPRIFIWDIQDTFYRIIAFFAISLVLLAIGFLYHHFRDRIASLDQNKQ